MHCAFKRANGSTVYRTLFPVKVVQGLQDDLFSITAEMSKGGILSSDQQNNIVLQYDDGQDIAFDRRCKTRDGWIAGAEVLPCKGEVAKLSSDGSVKHSKRKDVNVLHRELGHPGEDMTRATGKHMGFTLTGTFAPCEDCGIGKAKQTKMKKGVSSKSKTPGERIFIDISSPKTKSLGGKNHCCLLYTSTSPRDAHESRMPSSA